MPAWTTETTNSMPVERHVIKVGGVMHGAEISLKVTDIGKVYCHFDVSTSELRDTSIATEKVTWPAEAIAHARAFLDELEAKLSE